MRNGRHITESKTEKGILITIHSSLFFGRSRFLNSVLSLALLSFVAPALRAQSALDGFDPGANNLVSAAAVQADGKIVVGGYFTTLGGGGTGNTTRNRIAQLNPDGSVHTNFNPGANNSVLALAVQTDGKILVGGDFTGLGGGTGTTARNRIGRLNADGSVDTGFNPGANNRVNMLAVQADGKILVAGDFTALGGGTRNKIGRLNPDGSLDISFDPGANATVRALAVQADGKILVAGDFTTLGGGGTGTTTRNYIGRLNPNGSLDTSFNPGANSNVSSLALQADGKILVGGDFTTLGGGGTGTTTRNRLGRLNANGTLDTSFDPGANSSVFVVTLQTDGKILVGGNFTTLGGGGTGTATRNYVGRLNPNGTLDPGFNPGANAFVSLLAVQADGKILVGGNFTTLGVGTGNTPRSKIGRLQPDGRVDRTLEGFIDGGYVSTTGLQADGKILIGGQFNNVLGMARGNIARLNTDGTLDTAFDPTASATVYAIAVQPVDGKILVAGSFTTIGWFTTRIGLARLDATTGGADSWDPNANASVDAIAVQADGKILVAGIFTTIGGQTRNGLARLDATTGAADSFDPNANGSVDSIVVQADGKILVGGSFTSIGGQTRNYIARLDPTTGAADSFDPNANGGVDAIAVHADGKIVAAGRFTTIGGQTRNYIARLDPTTGAADSFNPNANNGVVTVAVQADGKVLAGGSFSSIGGQSRALFARLDGATGLADSFDRNYVVDEFDFFLSTAVQADGKVLAGGRLNQGALLERLSNDTAALQNLAVTQSAITWTRGGASPQFARVTFESSTDNVNYTLLGNGTSSGSNWTLTGLNLPTGQNIYIRARGYYSSGNFNGSESITESVRNAFITLPPTPTAVVSRKLHNGAPFDITLPLTGNPGIECRSGGATNDYQVKISFANSVTVNGIPQADLITGTGDIGTGGSSNGGVVSINGAVVTVPLTNVGNAQTIVIMLSNVSDGTKTGDLTIPMSVLLGDTTGSGSVNSSDIGQTKSKSGQAVSASNFRTDVTVSGSINSSDIGLVKSKSGTALP